jgi:hypothetical protein
MSDTARGAVARLIYRERTGFHPPERSPGPTEAATWRLWENKADDWIARLKAAGFVIMTVDESLQIRAENGFFRGLLHIHPDAVLQAMATEDRKEMLKEVDRVMNPRAT